MGRKGEPGAPAPHQGIELQLAMRNSRKTWGSERGRASPKFSGSRFEPRIHVCVFLLFPTCCCLVGVSNSLSAIRFPSGSESQVCPLPARPLWEAQSPLLSLSVLWVSRG